MLKCNFAITRHNLEEALRIGMAHRMKLPLSTALKVQIITTFNLLALIFEGATTFCKNHKYLHWPLSLICALPRGCTVSF